MPGLAKALRSARACAAAIVCAGAAGAVAAAGCVERVSLGSGATEGGGSSDELRPKLTIPIAHAPDDEVIVDDLKCQPGLTTDLDGDGWTPAQGDCNDCDRNMGPSAVEMPTPEGEEPSDEDCDGLVDEDTPVCDADLAVDDPNALSAARALDLCEVANAGRWGVVKAVWVMPDGGTPPPNEPFALGHGLLSGFGPAVSVRRGARMLALSSGTARQPTDPDWEDPRGFEKGFSSKSPDGVPQASPSCPGVHAGTPFDGVALELVLRAPQNAEAFAFDFDFYTFEFPDRVCSSYDDLFVALFTPAGGPSMNVSLDGAGNPVSVNSAFFEVCSCAGGPPCLAGGQQHPCSVGPAPLVGTGFGADMGDHGDRGATGWLTTAAPVERGGTITLRFSVHDAGDARFDSTVLLDNFRWRRDDTQVATTIRSPLP